jgi:hypothetical protein
MGTIRWLVMAGMTSLIGCALIGPRPETDLIRDDEIEEMTRPVGWTPLREGPLRAGSREIRIIEPTWNMFPRPVSLLRLAEDPAGRVEGEYALAWRTGRHRPFDPRFRPRTLSDRGCRTQVTERGWTVCPVEPHYSDWDAILAGLDSLNAFEDPDAGSMLDDSGRVIIYGMCTDSPALDVQIRLGVELRAYGLNACGSAKASARLEGLYRLLARIDPEIASDIPLGAGFRDP